MILAALAAVVASASGSIIPLAEMNEMRASASAPSPVPAVEKEAGPAAANGTVPAWFQALLAGTATISTSATTCSTPAAVTSPDVTPPVAASSTTSISKMPIDSPVTSELTLNPVPTP